MMLDGQNGHGHARGLQGFGPLLTVQGSGIEDGRFLFAAAPLHSVKGVGPEMHEGVHVAFALPFILPVAGHDGGEFLFEGLFLRRLGRKGRRSSQNTAHRQQLPCPFHRSHSIKMMYCSPSIESSAASPRAGNLAHLTSKSADTWDCSRHTSVVTFISLAAPMHAFREIHGGPVYQVCCLPAWRTMAKIALTYQILTYGAISFVLTCDSDRFSLQHYYRHYYRHPFSLQEETMNRSTFRTATRFAANSSVPVLRARREPDPPCEVVLSSLPSLELCPCH